MGSIKFSENEYWYLGVINDGYLFPLDVTSKYSFDFSANDTFNQINPLMLSSRGRYLWVDKCKVKFDKGIILIDGEYDFGEGYGSLKGAYEKARDTYFGKICSVDDYLIDNNIQYCTWMALKHSQNQDGIIKYAEGILKSGLPSGLMIIDDSWQKAFGDWEFTEKFSNPKEMVEKLHSLGFKVSLWVVPYVSFDSASFPYLEQSGYLLNDENGKTLHAHTFLGELAVLDFFNKNAVKWLIGTLNNLREKYNIDGFKFDGGDEQDLKGYAGDKVGFCEKWNNFYTCSITEYRATYKSAGTSAVQRLADKAHIWEVKQIVDKSIQEEPFMRYGLSCVIPNSLMQGLFGYYYSCPDMVGGGLSFDLNEQTVYDDELVIRSVQAECFAPFMQFSFAFWEKNEIIRKAFLEAIKKRNKLKEYIKELFINVPKTGEPIMRLLEYEFPKQGFEKVTDAFMLGSKYLIAPISVRGEKNKKIRLPEGKWVNIENGKVYDGNEEFTLKVEINSLFIFERQN